MSGTHHARPPRTSADLVRTCMTCGRVLVTESDRRHGECVNCSLDGPDDYDTELCWDCDGEGSFHDCGEDTCCCRNPEGPPRRTCETCGGTGDVRVSP